MTEKNGGQTRRDFLKTTIAGLAGVGLAELGLFNEALAHHPAGSYRPDLKPPPLKLEPNPVLRVLRWSGFVKSDEELWNENTRKWEAKTGGNVILEYLSWEDVRPKAAMTASVGAGHDIIISWYDDPHLYPGKLLDVTDLAVYLDKKYGGWYDVHKEYGIDKKTKRWIALPIGAPGLCINYRESWVREAGYEKPPDRVDEFLKLCKKLKANGHPTGFALGHAVGDANVWTHWCLWSFGGKIVEKDGKTIAINKPQTWDALEFARGLYDTMIPGVAAWLDPHNNKAFLAGEISLTNNGISIYYAAKDKFPEIAKDMNHVNFPVGPVGRPTELHLMSQAMIFRHTKFPNAAKHYLLFMFEEDQYGPWIDAMRGYVTQSLRYYSHLDVWTRDPKHTPFRDTVLRMLPNGYAGPLGPASAAAMAEYIIVDMFADVCTRGVTPKAAATTAQDRLARYYKR